MDETNIKVKGRWRYLYQAADKAGDTIDFPLEPSGTRLLRGASFRRPWLKTARPRQ